MASRTTQEVRAIPVEVTGGGSARVTQLPRVMLADVTPSTLGGSARVTQVSRIVIATIDLAGGGLMLRGIGS